MASKISLGCSNSGFQIGLNRGSVVNNFHPSIEGPKEKDHRACLENLFVTEPEEDLNMWKRRKGPRTSGTFSWFLESVEVKSWFRQAKAASNIEQNVMWLHGNPGIGKSTIAMMLAEELPKKDYFSRTDSLLYQIIKKHPSFMEQIMPRYEAQGKRLFSSFDALWAVLMDIGRALNGTEIYCVIDALDECDTESQDTLLEQIHQSFKQSNETSLVACKIHFLIISRPYSKIQFFLSTFRSVDLGSCKEIANDLRAMIQDKVQDLAKRKKYPESVMQKVSRILEEKADGTFLWVGIACRDLHGVPSRRAVETLLAKPRGLYPLYQNLLSAAVEANNSHDDSQLKMLLMIVTFALRPLKIAEIAEACRLYLDEDIRTRLQFTEEVIESCHFLIVIDKSYVRLLHRSVQEFLMTEMDNFTAVKSNLVLSYRCIELISQYCRPGMDKSVMEPTYGFLGYSVLYWSKHASLAETEFTALEEHGNFFQNKFGTWKCWLENYNHLKRGSWGALGTGISVSHVAARWGIIPLLLTAPQGAWEDNDDRGQSPLLIATESTQIEAMRFLVHSQVRLDSLNNKHQNVLHIVCMNGSFTDYDMVKSLLNKGVSPYICDEGSMTPLLYAIGDRRTELTQTFLNYGLNLESRVHRRSWPGRITVSSLPYGMVKGQDENMESGLTALHFAALNACTEMAILLLQCGADPNACSDFGDTPLHLGIRHRLLGRRNDDEWEVGRYAVESLTDFIEDHEGSEASDIHRNISDTRIRIVEILLESESINVNTPNNHGDYPQHLIDFHRPQALSILQKLMENGADALQPNGDRQTCLHLASKAGNLAVVCKLVEEGHDIMLEDSHGRSPFYYAVSRGFLDILSLMSKICDRVLPEVWSSLDHFGRTPLHHHVASVFCSAEVINFLIQIGCDVSQPDRAGNSPLGLYVSSFHLSIRSEIFLLFVQKGADPHWMNENGQTLAHLSMHHQGADTTILEYLFTVGIDPATTDLDGRTLMHHGALHGAFTEDLMNFLDCQGVLDHYLTATDFTCKTPLDYAKEMVHRETHGDVYDDTRWEESLKNLNATLPSCTSEGAK
ncbi:hypothetical protein E8E15_000479 [Penicillium rubens]|nr:hypothetical protein E8E15_000479 [Penicillium rubens]